ncbi:MAG: hypothetical protein H6867_08820 [Rhodospirillales bacterium]|nr:hypothetical protein [Rhodospirillales bacterium]MCB9995657.1 hypothetical protein [Rhodospirillales bacterium]
MSIGKDVLLKAFSLAGKFIPAAERQASKLLAQKHFAELCLKEGGDPVVRRLSFSLVKVSLRNAGYDTDTDKPYQEVLGLAGGKDEFESLKEKYVAKAVALKQEPR